MHGRTQRITDSEGRALAFISAEDLCLHKLVFGRPKDVTDLEALLASRTLDLEYVRSWLVQMIPPGDKRFAILDDLADRFADVTKL